MVVSVASYGGPALKPQDNSIKTRFCQFLVTNKREDQKHKTLVKSQTKEQARSMKYNESDQV